MQAHRILTMLFAFVVAILSAIVPIKGFAQSTIDEQTCQRRSKSLPLGRSKSRPVCLIFGYVFWPLQGPEDIVRH